MKFFTQIQKQYLLSTVCAIVSLSVPAYAQIEQQSGVADPGRASERMRQNLTVPQVSPDIQVKSMELLNAPAGAETINLKFGGFNITGNSVYSMQELLPIYQSKIGQTMTLADVYGIVNDITLKYRNDGYILTQVVVPPQTVDSGVVDIQVVEGTLDTVTVQADGRSAREIALIQSYANRIKSTAALNVREMERYLLLINDLPGVTSRTIISPSPTRTGAADMLIIVSNQMLEGTIGADNYGSRYLGQWAANASATLNSALGNNEAITMQTAFAPGTGYELLYGALSYEQPIGTLGTRVGALMSMTHTDPGFTLSQFDVRGHANLYSLYLRHPFIRSRNENLAGRLSFDVRDVKNSNNVEETRHDHVRAFRAGAKYDVLDTWIGTAVNSLDVQISKGLNVMGATHENDFSSRPAGDSEFTKIELSFQRLQRLTDKFNLSLSGRAQKASDALLSSEEIGLGGSVFGRGYDPSEVAGDNGIAGSAELQWNNPVDSWRGDVLTSTQLYTFLDSGTVWNIDATTSADKRDSLTSAGGGVRLRLAYDVDMDFGAARALTGPVASEGDSDMRYYFSINKKF